MTWLLVNELDGGVVPVGQTSSDPMTGSEGGPPVEPAGGEPLIWSALSSLFAMLGEVQQATPDGSPPSSVGSDLPFVGPPLPPSDPPTSRPSEEDFTRYLIEVTRAARDSKQTELDRSVQAEREALTSNQWDRAHANSTRLRAELAVLEARLRDLTNPAKPIADRLALAGPPRTLLDIRENATAAERFAVGMLRGLNNSINGLLVVVSDPAGAIDALRRLTIDPALQAALVDALIQKITDGSAENLGELTFEVAALLGPGAAAGGASAAGNAARIVVRVSRETAVAIRGATAEARAALRAAWLRDLAGSRPTRLGAVDAATFGTGATFPGTLNQAFTGSFADLTTAIQRVYPGFQGFAENVDLGGLPARFNPATRKIEFSMSFNQTTKGIVAEEVRHALDVAEGFNQTDVIAAFERETGRSLLRDGQLVEQNLRFFTNWHHRRVYTRMLQDAENGHPVMGMIVGRGDVNSIYELYMTEAFGRSPREWLLRQQFPNLYHSSP